MAFCVWVVVVVFCFVGFWFGLFDFCCCCFPPHQLEHCICRAVFIKDVPADFDVFFLLVLHCLKVSFIPFHLEKQGLYLRLLDTVVN